MGQAYHPRSHPGHLFAASYAILETEPLQVNVCVSEDCRVLLLDLTGLRRDEPWAAMVTRNLLTAAARKNYKLSMRSFHTAPTTVREHVTAYLNTEALRRGGRAFDTIWLTQSIISGTSWLSPMF